MQSDFIDASYAKAQEAVGCAYKDREKWTRLAMTQTISCGKFSSDCTVKDYVLDIWHLERLI